MRITLNLATRPFTDLGPTLKRLRIAMAVLAVALHPFFASACISSTGKPQAARAREHSLDGQIARIQAERQHAEALMSQPDNAQLLKQAQALNQLFDEKAFSWTLAMEALETVLPAGVQVTSIEPIRDKEGHITVHLRVVGPRDRAVDLVRNLERSRRFLQPRIVGENAESNNSPGQRLEPVSPSNRFDFDLLADYNPPTPEERDPERGQAAENGKAPASSSSASRHRKSGAAPATVSQPFRSSPRRQPYTRHRSQPPAPSRSFASPREEVRNERERHPPRLWRERLSSPLTWHFAGFAVLLVLAIGLADPPGSGLGRHGQPLQRCPRRQADSS